MEGGYFVVKSLPMSKRFSYIPVLPKAGATVESVWKWKSLSRVWLLATPWSIQSMEFSRPEYLLDWVYVLFSRGSSQSRDWTQVSCIAGRFFTSWTNREAQEYWSGCPIPSPADLPNLGIESGSPTLQANSLPTGLPWKPETNTKSLREPPEPSQSFWHPVRQGPWRQSWSPHLLPQDIRERWFHGTQPQDWQPRDFENHACFQSTKEVLGRNKGAVLSLDMDVMLQ